MTETKLHQLHTACRGCVFAEYQTSVESGKKSQTKCSLGKLEAYVKQGGLEAVLEAEDNDLEFYIVNGRPCYFHRTMSWAEELPHTEWPWMAAVRREVAMRVDVVIVLQEGDPWDPSFLGKSLECLKSQTLLPHSVRVVNNSNVKTGSLHAYLHTNAAGLNWSLTDILVRKGWERLSRLEAIDEVANKLEGHFYAHFTPGAYIPPSFIHDIDCAINDGLERFLLLKPVDGLMNGLVVHLPFARTYDGNQPGYGEENGENVHLENIVAKATYFAKTFDNPGLVASVEDVCKAFRS